MTEAIGMNDFDAKIARLEAGEEHIKDLLRIHVKRSEEIHEDAKASREEVKRAMVCLQKELASIRKTVEAYENKGKGMMIAGTVFLTAVGTLAGAMGAKVVRLFQ